MKKLLMLIFLITFTSFAQDEYLSEMENTVGYIKDESGNSYLVIETKKGAKLVKVNEKPENLLRSKLGITKEDLKLNGEGKWNTESYY